MNIHFGMEPCGSVPRYQSTRRHIRVYFNINIYRHENVTCHILREFGGEISTHKGSSKRRDKKTVVMGIIMRTFRKTLLR